MAIEDDIARAIQELGDEGTKIVTSVFKQSLGSVEACAKSMCPVGHYGAGRGKPGRPGGELQNSLRVEYVGLNGDELQGRCTSDLIYARNQHETIFHHPGKYTGVPGPPYRAAFFERGFAVVFGNGQDPLGLFSGPFPAGFEELLTESIRG